MEAQQDMKDRQDKDRDPRPVQLQIAKAMGIKQEVINFLDKVPDWKRRQWYFFLAQDSYPLSELLTMEKEKWSEDKIKKQRIDYLKQRLINLEPFARRVSDLQREVQETMTESRETRNLIANSLDALLEKQAQTQAETIAAQNEQIRMLKEQLANQNGQQRQGGEVTYHYEREQDHRKPQSPMHKEMTGSEKGGTGKGRFAFWRKDPTQEFVQTFLKESTYSPEQVDFLLSCHEEGLSRKEIEQFADPNLSIEVMQRLKQMLFK